jgi:hypothetical protein
MTDEASGPPPIAFPRGGRNCPAGRHGRRGFFANRSGDTAFFTIKHKMYATPHLTTR